MQTRIEYQTIIEHIVKANKLYESNKDLLEEFCKEIYKRTYLVLPTKDNEKELIEYISIISNKVIKEILSNNQRPTEIEEKKDKDIANFAIDKNKYVEEYDYDEEEKIEASKNPYRDYVLINDPLYLEVKKNLRPKMKKLVSAIYEIHSQMPEKLYFQIFYYKYCKGLESIDVARKTGLPQGELSRRILSLIQILKAYNIKLD